MRDAARWTGLARALVTLGAAGAIGVGALTGATPALGDISTTGSDTQPANNTVAVTVQPR